MTAVIKVWVLVLSVNSFNGGGPAVIDNIASEAECSRLADTLARGLHAAKTACYSVDKVMPRG